MMSLSLPTRYVNITAAIVYNADLPDPLFRTYARLAGLAWRDKAHDYTQLPALTLNELAACCHLKPRAMRLHLDQLQELGYITCTGTAAHYVIQIQTPGVQSFTQVQSFTLHDDHVVVDDLDLNKGDQQQHDGKVQNFTLSENLRALEAFGVNPAIPDAQRVAALPHVTPEFIQAWGQDLATARDTRNLPGRLLYKLETTHQLPRVETRGRFPRTTAAPPAAPPAPAALPETVLADLERLGFTGPVDEVAAVYTRDPAFVTAWLEYCQRHATTLRNPAGTFRHKLRGAAYPPEALPLPATPPPSPAPPSPAAQLWRKMLAALELQMTRATFDQWLRGSQGQELTEENTLQVVVSDPRAVGWLEGQLAPVIARTAAQVSTPPVTIQFILPAAATTATGGPE